MDPSGALLQAAAVIPEQPTRPPPTAKAGFFDALYEAMSSIEGRAIDCHLVLDFSCRWSHEDLRLAAGVLVKQYPLLSCRYARGWVSDRWEPCAPDLSAVLRLEQVDADLDDRTRTLVNEPLRPHELWPFRVALLEHAGGTRMLFSWVHAVSDLRGMVAALKVFAEALMKQPSPVAPTVGRSFLRNVFSGTTPKRLPDVVKQLFDGKAGPFDSTGRWTRPYDFGTGGSATLDYSNFVLSPAEYRAFVRRCGSNMATAHDGILAAIARVLGQRSEGAVAVSYSVDLRNPRSNEPVALAPLSGSLDLAVPRSVLGSFDETVKYVAATVKRQRFGAIPKSLFFTGWMPHALLRQVVRRVGAPSPPERPEMHVSHGGSLDPSLAAFGAHLVNAWMPGNFFPGMRAPITASCLFRGQLVVAVSGFQFMQPGMRDYARDLEEALRKIATSAG